MRMPSPILSPAGLARKELYWQLSAMLQQSRALTYGGVSLFVVTFVVLPIAISLFRAADIPKG